MQANNSAVSSQRIFQPQQIDTIQWVTLFLTLDGLNDADSRKGVRFGGFVDTAPNFGGEMPQKPAILGA